MSKSSDQLDGEIEAVFAYEKAGKPADVERWVDDWIRQNRDKEAWARPRFAKAYVETIRGTPFLKRAEIGRGQKTP